MRSRILASTLTLCAVASSALAAPPQPDLRLRGFAAGLDRRPVIATSPVDGREWAAWTYRNGSESDIAIATRIAGGAWTDPAFLGRHDRLDEVEPAREQDRRAPGGFARDLARYRAATPALLRTSTTEWLSRAHRVALSAVPRGRTDLALADSSPAVAS